VAKDKVTKIKLNKEKEIKLPDFERQELSDGEMSIENVV